MVTSPPWTEGGRPAPPDAALDPEDARAALRDFHRLRRRMLHSRRHGLGHRAVQAYFAARGLRFPFRLLGAARRAGPIVRREHGTPLSRQLRDMVRVWWRHGLDPKDYYENHLFRPARLAQAEFHVHPWHNVEIFAGFHGWGNVPFDKIGFHDRARAAGLPVVPILAVCPPGGPPEVREPDSPHWEGDLFSKRAEGGRGRSQRRWRRSEGGGLADDHGVAFDSVEALLEHLSRRVRRGRDRHSPVIVQPCVRNHEAVHDVTRGGLSTVRICVSQRSRGRPAEVVFTAMKLVVGDAPVDNMSDGRNLVGGVDLATGRVLNAFRIGEGGLLEPVERHPDSGRPVAELVLPSWKEAIARCIEAMTVFPESPSLGWDVAMTPEGPVLVEANIMWGSANLTGWPIGLTPYPRWTVEWLGEALRARGAAPDHPQAR